MATYNTFKELAEHLGIDPEHPTVADQQKVRDWMAQNPEYEAGSVTNNYLNAKPSLFDYDQPPQDVVEPDTSNLQIQVPGIDPNRLSQAEQPATEQAQQTRRIPNFGKFKDTDVFNRAMGAWSPLASAAFAGGDRSGEAAGYRAGAAIQDKAAAENEKFMQWNKQRAADNTLADKVAAAQASGKWKQNANALGAEGGASVVASQNEAVTPDIMAQKQYQSQQMNTATQNLAEVNARKIAAQNNRTKADQTDYNTQVQESQNAYKYNLATANDQSEQEKKEKKPEEPKQENKPTENKPVEKSTDEQSTDESKAAAETNQQSQATVDATQVAADKQAASSLIDEVNDLNNNTVPDLHNGRDGKQMTKAEHYALIEQEYNQIKARTPDIPALPPLNVQAGNIATAINDITN